jgi:hypothetical protein
MTAGTRKRIIDTVKQVIKGNVAALDRLSSAQWVLANLMIDFIDEGRLLSYDELLDKAIKEV